MRGLAPASRDMWAQVGQCAVVDVLGEDVHAGCSMLGKVLMH